MNTFEVNDEHLEHLFGLGYKKPRKNHKYIKKIETPKGARYFYTEADLKAYYARQKAKEYVLDKWDGRISRQKQRKAASKLNEAVRGAFIDYSINDIEKAKKDYVDATEEAQMRTNSSIKGFFKGLIKDEYYHLQVSEIRIPKFGTRKAQLLIDQYKDVPIILLPENVIDQYALDKYASTPNYFRNLYKNYRR